MFKTLFLQLVECIKEKGRERFNEITCAPATSVQRVDSDRGLHFTVLKASGGTVIETRIYDQRNNRMNQGLYVITNEQDLGKEIDKILTMESLR